MLADEWKLAHSVLSSSMNLGLLHPAEVADAAERGLPTGDAPINSVEGFVRQVIGWREYVWGVFWLWMPDYRGQNELDADRPVPPAFTGDVIDGDGLRRVTRCAIFTTTGTPTTSNG